jgi:hypothetical protein
MDNGNLGDPITMTIMERSIGKEIIIAFSGTKSPHELFDEVVKGYPVDYDLHPSIGSKVEGFFYYSYKNAFRDTFMTKIKEMSDSWHDLGYKIVFTGHSFGGTLAIHAAADAILEGIIKKHKVHIYTFGMPRVGNLEFYEQFISECDEFYRLVHNRDMIPHVPPCISNLSGGCVKKGYFPIFFHHAPTEVWYTKDNSAYTVCSKTEGEDTSCSNKEFHDSIDDHLVYFGIRVGQMFEHEFNEIETKESRSEILKISK